jgi:hypothetical protein
VKKIPNPNPPNEVQNRPIQTRKAAIPENHSLKDLDIGTFSLNSLATCKSVTCTVGGQHRDLFLVQKLPPPPI